MRVSFFACNAFLRRWHVCSFEPEAVMIGGTELRPLAVRQGAVLGQCALHDCSGVIVENIFPIHPIDGAPYDHVVLACTAGCGCRATFADPETVRAAAAQVGYSLEEGRFITAA